MQLDQHDLFCLNGNELVILSAAYSSYGGANTVYRTEINTYQDIRAHGQAGDGPAWFEVRTKAGHILQFGNSNTSRIEAQGKDTVLTWLLNRISDRFGNQINISYHERNEYSEGVPKQITYQLAPNVQASIDFSYDDLDPKLLTPNDEVNTLNASRISQSRYLTEVKVTIDNLEHRQYTLSYKHRNVENKQFPLLTSIQECIETQCLPSITLDWHEQHLLSASDEATISTKPAHLNIIDKRNVSHHPLSQNQRNAPMAKSMC